MLFDDQYSELSEINLEANCIGDTKIIKICESISKSLIDKIRYLNLGQNLISDKSCANIASLVRDCLNLEVLIVYENHIRNFGAALIMGEIKSHVSIKVFDISWNTIGENLTHEPTISEIKRDEKVRETEGRKFMNVSVTEMRKTMTFNTSDDKPRSRARNISPFAKELSNLFLNLNSKLIHLDISHNNMDSNDSKFLCEEVKQNHSILGLHVDGNEMRVDDLGFLFPTNNKVNSHDYYANSQIYYQIAKGHPNIRTKITNVRKIRSKNNCWICEGWKEVMFTYKPKKVKDITSLNVKLHLSFENYIPTETILKIDVFVCYRMVPPGEILYYFTVNETLIENYGSDTVNAKEDIYFV